MGYYIKRPYMLHQQPDYEQMAQQFTTTHTLMDVQDVTKLKDIVDDMMGADTDTDGDIVEFLKWITQQDPDDAL